MCQCAPGRRESSGPAVTHLLLVKREASGCRDERPHLLAATYSLRKTTLRRPAACVGGSCASGRPINGLEKTSSAVACRMDSRWRDPPNSMDEAWRGDGKRHGSARQPPQCPLPAAMALRAPITVLWVPHGGCSCRVQRSRSSAQGIVFAGAAWRHRNMRHTPEGRRRGGLAIRLHGGAAATCEVLPPPLSPPNPARHPSPC